MFSERSAKRGASASAEAAAVDAKIATTTEPAAAVCVTTEAAAANPIIEAVQDVTTEAKTNVVAEAKMLRCVPIPAIAPCVDRLPPDATTPHHEEEDPLHPTPTHHAVPPRSDCEENPKSQSASEPDPADCAKRSYNKLTKNIATKPAEPQQVQIVGLCVWVG